MKKTPLLSVFRGSLPVLLAAMATLCMAGDSAEDTSARDFVAHFGEEQFKHTSPGIIEAFPMGRSESANDKRLTKFPLITSDWKLETKHYKYYVFEGDHYAVQWIFQSKWNDNGILQREGTLAFGVVKDGQLVHWTEYFDDSVGELQHDGKMGYYSATEEPYPWPEKPNFSRPYRTYDPHSVQWKNYPTPAPGRL